MVDIRKQLWDPEIPIELQNLGKKQLPAIFQEPLVISCQRKIFNNEVYAQVRLVILFDRIA